MSPQHATGWALPPGGGRRVADLVAFVVALAAGGLLVLAPRPAQPQAVPTTTTAAPPAAAELVDVWPQANVVSRPDRLADGTQFTPRLYLDTFVAIGTAPAVGDDAIRVVLLTPQEMTELRRVRSDHYPEIGGFTVTGDTVLWAETTYPPRGDTLAQIWRFDRTTMATTLVAQDDTGVDLTGSQNDLIVVDQTVYWVSTRFTNVTVTEIRSAPLDGGPVSVVRQELGTYSLAGWPWLVTPYRGQGNPIRLVNTDTGEYLIVPQNQGELALCSATWCRVTVVSDTGPIRIDLMRPDGADRHRIAGAESYPILNDVALQDRFEPLVTYNLEPDAPPSPPQLTLYDIRTKKTAILSVGVVNAGTGGGLLWWSTGTERDYTWHALDLRTLTQ